MTEETEGSGYSNPHDNDLTRGGETVAECHNVDDEERARPVLAQPVPEGKREAYDSEPDVEPEPFPVCPAYGATDLLLDGVDEVNHWRCCTCGHRWDEVPPAH